MGIVVRYRKVLIPEIGIETRYRKVSIPQKGIDTQHYCGTLKGFKESNVTINGLMGHQYQTVKEILPKHRPAHKSHHSTVQLKTTKLKLIFL